MKIVKGSGNGLGPILEEMRKVGARIITSLRLPDGRIKLTLHFKNSLLKASGTGVTREEALEVALQGWKDRTV